MSNKQSWPEPRGGIRVPDRVLEALSRVRGKYSDIRHVFHCINLFLDDWIGVAGDGDNGGYEHFRFKDGKLTITDCGYGMTEIALRDALNLWEPPKLLDAAKAFMTHQPGDVQWRKCEADLEAAIAEMEGRKA